MRPEKYVSKHGLETHGIRNVHQVHWNLRTPGLYEEIVRRSEGSISHLGPVVVRTGQHTGRSAGDKYIVDEPTTSGQVWWNAANQPYPVETFDQMFHRLMAYLQGKDLFVQDCYAGADPQFRMPIRVINETAWHNLFARNMFIRAQPDALHDHEPQFTVLHVPNFIANPELDRTRSEVFVIVNLARKLVLIGGTSYAGEIKKSIFSVMNFLLPGQEVLPMHCSANVGADGDSAVFFGLSGTGKTTLSADPERALIGDDEHGWSDRGVFNFEGGCYAKVIRLDPAAEPDIYACTRRFGTVLENVGFDCWSRRVDLEDSTLTENTRAAYPISHIPGALREGMAGHPKNVILLTADAFGVMPPLSRLTPDQVMYHFISGYTAKVAGTERGMGKEPQATFSACFGAPFLLLHPFEYARLLSEKIEAHGSNCWLVNTGWTGGPYGTGHRMPIGHTRALLKAAMVGALDGAEFRKDPVFGFDVPLDCPGLPREVLDPRGTWADGEAYDRQAAELAGRFRENFTQYEERVTDEVKAAGPQAG